MLSSAVRLIFLTTGRDNGHIARSDACTWRASFQDCHQELLQLATGQHNAYTYCHDERGIHAQVIADAMLGAMPSGTTWCHIFNPCCGRQGRGGEAEKPATRTPYQATRPGRATAQDLQDAQQKLIECLAHKAGWLVFFYTDVRHHPVALRLRQPYSRKFVSFKPGRAGLFGRELFTPYANPANQALNDFLLVVEGNSTPCNSNRSPCATRRPPRQTSYVHACAVGGVLVADVDTLKPRASGDLV